MKDNINGHKAIVFCIDHYNPLGVVRSLGEEGVNAIVILVSEHPILITHSKYPSVIHRVNNRDEGLALLNRLYGHEAKKPIVFICDDKTMELFDGNYDELHTKYIFYNARQQGRVTYYMNKHNINVAAAEAGFRIPQGEVLKKFELPKHTPYPVMTKAIASTKGAWKKDVFVCNSPEELMEAYKHIKSDELLVEEFITKKNELVIDGISLNGGEYVYIPLQSLYHRFSKTSYGNYMTMSRVNDIALRDKITSLIRNIRFTGIFEVELLVTEDNDLVFLEVNFRNSTWSYASTFAGANLPMLWAKSETGEEFDPWQISIRQEPFTAMAEVNDFFESVRHGSIGLSQWLREFHTCDCTYIYNRNDKGPAFAIVKSILASTFKKVLHLN